jgi:UDP-N-acetylglucosamine--N-acetylmuramyl-(pentapeptide) pyrophosphoryl-undecaprenol N-acetylglucosamine transferase
MLVASSGGHLWELVRLAPGLDATRESLWVTFDTTDSHSLLNGVRTLYVPYVGPRDIIGTARAVPPIRSALNREPFDGLVSTGAALALSAMIAALGRVHDRLYVESLCRFTGPSLTGRIIAQARLARTMTQHQAWSGGRWSYGDSILHDYTRPPRLPAPGPVTRVFVTVGTIRPYPFRRLLDRLMRIIPAGVEVTWQVGETPAEGVRGRVFRYLDAIAFDMEVYRADVVVTHAGIATMVGLLDRGVFPVVVPREAVHGEHVDDHQCQAADAFHQSGLGIARRVDELTWEDVEEAHRWSICSTHG